MPFIGPGVVAYSPEISVIDSGVINDVRAVVSADRKYVTLTMRASDSTLLALQQFSVQRGVPLGFVGDPPTAAAAARPARNPKPAANPAAAAPWRVATAPPAAPGQAQAAATPNASLPTVRVPAPPAPAAPVPAVPTLVVPPPASPPTILSREGTTALAPAP